MKNIVMDRLHIMVRLFHLYIHVSLNFKQIPKYIIEYGTCDKEIMIYIDGANYLCLSILTMHLCNKLSHNSEKK